VQELAVSSNGQFIAALNSSRTEALPWMADGALAGKLNAGGERLWHLAFSPDAQTLVTVFCPPCATAPARGFLFLLCCARAPYIPRR
jgi:hypothetical protein